LQYGEAQSAESRKDFIHKMKIALKELRGSFICLKIIEQKKYVTDQKLANTILELDELIAIFATSIETAARNLKKP
jgi:four helix bundle protein